MSNDKTPNAVFHTDSLKDRLLNSEVISKTTESIKQSNEGNTKQND